MKRTDVGGGVVWLAILFLSSNKQNKNWRSRNKYFVALSVFWCNSFQLGYYSVISTFWEHDQLILRPQDTSHTPTPPPWKILDPPRSLESSFVFHDFSVTA